MKVACYFEGVSYKGGKKATARGGRGRGEIKE